MTSLHGRKIFHGYSQPLALRTTTLRAAPRADLGLVRMYCAPDRAGMNDPDY
jgi:hypothetical protein